MLWFNSILDLNFIFFCFKLIIVHYHTQKQKKIKFKTRIKLNYNIFFVLHLMSLLVRITCQTTPPPLWKRVQIQKLTRLMAKRQTEPSFLLVTMSNNEQQEKSILTTTDRRKSEVNNEQIQLLIPIQHQFRQLIIYAKENDFPPNNIIHSFGFGNLNRFTKV